MTDETLWVHFSSSLLEVLTLHQMLRPILLTASRCRRFVRRRLLCTIYDMYGQRVMMYAYLQVVMQVPWPRG